MTTPEEIIKAYDYIKIAFYALTVPPLALCLCLLAMMLISKDRDKLCGLIVICILIIHSMVATIALN
jgi:hypothetical protein